MSTSLDGNVLDQVGRPVPGALVYIYDQDGDLAPLTDALGVSATNPVTAGEDGYWSAFVAEEGYYTFRYFWAGRQRLIAANQIAGRTPLQQVEGSAEAAALSRDQAADLVLPANIFVDVAQATAEAGLSEGTYFKLVDSSTGNATVYRRDAVGSTELYGEVTKSALGSPVGSAFIGHSRGSGGTLADALNDLYVTPELFADNVGDGTPDDLAFELARNEGLPIALGAKSYALESPLALRTNQELYGMSQKSTLVGVGPSDTQFIIETIGFPSATINTLVDPVLVDPYVSTVKMASQANFSIGMIFVLHDPVVDKFEVNVVEGFAADGQSIVTKWPIAQPFPVPSRVLVRRGDFITDTRVRNLRLAGRGGGVRCLYTDSFTAQDLVLDNLTYIGISAEGGIGTAILRNKIDKVGASGVGFRVSRQASCIGNTVRRGPQSDESFTAYYSCSHILFAENQTAQPVFGGGELPAGGAGNSFLLDIRCSQIAIVNNTCEGSATYQVLVTGSLSGEDPGTFFGCRDIIIEGNTLGRANLGHIKVEGQSKRGSIAGNTCSTVTDALDPILPGTPSTASIRVMEDCSGWSIGTNAISGAAGMEVEDRQVSPGKRYATRMGVGTTVPYGTFDVRGSHTVTSQDFIAGSQGTALAIGLGAASGNTYGQINVGTNGDNDVSHLALMAFGGGVGVGRTSAVSGGLLEVNGRLVQNVSPEAPTLAVSGDMAPHLVDNATLRFHVRGMDGVTRPFTLTADAP